MKPESNIRNPWITEMLQQEDSVKISGSGTDPNIPLKSATVFQSTTTVIQAIVAFAAGIASLRNEVCQV